MTTKTTDDCTVAVSMAAIGQMWRHLTRTQMTVWMLNMALGSPDDQFRRAEIIASYMGDVDVMTVHGAMNEIRDLLSHPSPDPCDEMRLSTEVNRVPPAFLDTLLDACHDAAIREIEDMDDP